MTKVNGMLLNGKKVIVGFFVPRTGAERVRPRRRVGPQKSAALQDLGGDEAKKEQHTQR